MFSKRKIYYGDDAEEDLFKLLKTEDTGAYFEIVYRFYRQLTSALSEIFTTKILKNISLCDYVDCLLQAENTAQNLSSNTFILLWNYKTAISATSLYDAIFDMLEIELSSLDYYDQLIYDEQWKFKILTRFYLQYRQIKHNIVLRRCLLIWLTEEKEIHSQFFTMKFFESKSMQQIQQELQLSSREIEAQLQLIHLRFEVYLPKIVDRLH